MDNLKTSIGNYLGLLTPTVIFGISGVAAISIISNVHSLILHAVKFAERQRDLNACMKGVVTTSYRGVKSVEVRSNLPLPKITSPDEVLIKVIAAGVDEMDLMITWGYGKGIRSYLNQHMENESAVILGRECSGYVADVGDDVHSLQVGDEVWAVSPYCGEGLMAEYVVVKESQVSCKPRNITFEEAASFPYCAIQACNALEEIGLTPKWTRNKRVLVVTGNSPFGLFVVQLLKSWGADLTASVPTAGLPMCHELNVDDVIVYTVTDFETELRRRKSFDITINAIGTVIHELCVDITSPGGRVVTLTTTPLLTDRFSFAIGCVLSLMIQILAWIKKINRGAIRRFKWNNFSYDRRHLKKTADYIEKELVIPIIQRVYDIDDALIPFHKLARFDNVGKNVIRISRTKNY